MGFVFLRKAILEGCAGNSQSLAMDLHDQYVYMEKTGQWRFTPPTHVVVALAEADRAVRGRGRASPPGWRATRTTTAPDRRHVAAGLHALPRSLGAGADHRHLPRAGDSRYDFKTFYAFAREHGFVLYPGKLTQVETFRVGCIGAIGRHEMEQAVHAVELALQDMGIASGEPAL
jgi:2-aminoethylphosphonate-pyruvate transaminase